MIKPPTRAGHLQSTFRTLHHDVAVNLCEAVEAISGIELVVGGSRNGYWISDEENRHERYHLDPEYARVFDQMITTIGQYLEYERDSDNF